MLNTMQPGSAQGHDAKRGEILERISREYGRPEEKQREAVKKLGKDEFFKIMVTQIQHQDPLKPYNNEEMAAQMAQFTSLEQMVNVNQNLEKLAQAQQPIANMGAANLIGKYVTADASRVRHTEGKYSDLKFELPNDAAKVHVALLNERGETIREFDQENAKKGPVSIQWDGKKSNNMAAPTGTYLMQIGAQDERGRQIQVQTAKTDIVHGVAFEGKETVLLVGDLKNPTKLMLSNVSKIVDTHSGVASGAAPSVSGLPPGVQIGGLENLVNRGGDAPPPEVEEKTVEGYVPGQNKNFTPFNIDAYKKANQPQVYRQPVNDEDIREAIERGQDLTAANPVAERIKSHEVAEAAPRQPVPSSVDGSTAGKWSE